MNTYEFVYIYSDRIKIVIETSTLGLAFDHLAETVKNPEDFKLIL